MVRVHARERSERKGEDDVTAALPARAREAYLPSGLALNERINFDEPGKRGDHRMARPPRFPITPGFRLRMEAGSEILLNEGNTMALSLAAAAALSAPPAPAVATAATGGTVLAGTYLVAISYVNALGETVGSAQASVVTTGSTSTITITAPASPGGGATGWYAYVSGAGTTVLSRQGGSQAFGVNLVITAPPTTGGANPLVALTGMWAAGFVDQACGPRDRLFVNAAGAPLNGIANSLPAVASVTQFKDPTGGVTGMFKVVLTPNALDVWNSSSPLVLFLDQNTWFILASTSNG